MTPSIRQKLSERNLKTNHFYKKPSTNQNCKSSDQQTLGGRLLFAGASLKHQNSIGQNQKGADKQ